MTKEFRQSKRRIRASFDVLGKYAPSYTDILIDLPQPNKVPCKSYSLLVGLCSYSLGLYAEVMANIQRKESIIRMLRRESPDDPRIAEVSKRCVSNKRYAKSIETVLSKRVAFIKAALDSESVNTDYWSE